LSHCEISRFSAHFATLRRKNKVALQKLPLSPHVVGQNFVQILLPKIDRSNKRFFFFSTPPLLTRSSLSSTSTHTHAHVHALTQRPTPTTSRQPKASTLNVCVFNCCCLISSQHVFLELGEAFDFRTQSYWKPLAVSAG
jgi:hypothetical protein